MKKFKYISFLFLMIMTLGILSSCSVLGGLMGQQGTQGEVGPQGPQGEKGEDGTSLLTGYGKPENSVGNNSDSYIDLESWDFYIKNDDVWNWEGNIKGSSEKYHNGTEGLIFYPLNDTECAVAAGTARYLKEIIIPEKYKNYTVTTIACTSDAERGFGECYNLERIVIPDTVTNIMSAGAFDSCYNLKEIVIPSNNTSSIDIEDLRNLENVYYGGTLEDWINREWRLIKSNYDTSSYSGFNLFVADENGETVVNGKKYTLVTDVVIPEGTEKINAYHFLYCKSIKNISIPESVNYVGKAAFYGCNSLQYNKYKDGLYLGNSKNPYIIFMGAENNALSTIEINENTKIIYDKALNKFSDLIEVIMPENLISINSYAFINCKKLSSIIIPSSVTSVGYGAFYGCSSLTIYCESESQPIDWDKYWNNSNRTVYWAGQWEYDTDGNPVPLG